MSETSTLLRTGEKVMWRGKPRKASFMIGGFVASIFGVIWLSFSLFAMWLSTFQGLSTFVTLFLSFFVLIGIGLTIGPPLWQVLRYKHTNYLITNQRLITQTGAIGVDTRFVELDNIQEVYVNVSFLDKVCGTGSLIVVTAGFPFLGRAYPVITAVEEPYKVQKLLQEARILMVQQ